MINGNATVIASQQDVDMWIKNCEASFMFIRVTLKVVLVGSSVVRDDMYQKKDIKGSCHRMEQE